MTTRRSAVLLVAAAAVFVAVTAHDFGAAGRYAIDGMSAVAVGIAWWAVVRTPEGRGPWVLAATGLSLWLVGDIIWDVYVSTRGAAPSVSMADAFYLVSYPFIGASLGWMARRRSPRTWQNGLADGIGVTAVGALAAWQFLIDAGSGTYLERMIAAAYPLGDVLVLGMFAWLVLSPGRRTASTWFMFGGISLVLAADLLLAVGSRIGTDLGSTWWDNSYPIAYLLIALALAHSSRRDLVAADRHLGERLHPGRVIFLGIALFGAPVLAATSNSRTGRVPTWAYLGVTIALGCLVLARFLGAVRKVEAAHAALGYQARHDALTGLSNRASLIADLGRLLGDAARTHEPLVVFYIDLDRFKPINDTMGHGAGDELLHQVGQRLNAHRVEGAVVARLGGDEFVVVMPAMVPARAQDVASSIVHALVEPFELSQGVVGISASVGVAFSEPGDSAELVLKRADNALYEVKRSGRNGWQIAPLALVGS